MKERIILKSAHPEEYGDLVVECKKIENDKIGEYIESIPEERKFSAYKTAEVNVRTGTVGEKINTTLYVERDGNIYILSEETNEVKLRKCKDGVERADVVVTNINSTSNEEYIVKFDKFIETYEVGKYSITSHPEVRQFAQVNEDVIIMTAWGAPAICLNGSYIVTYNADENDYNTVEQGAFDSTYTRECYNGRKIRRKF